MAGGLLNFLAPRREQRNVLADVLRRKSMADNAPVNSLAAPGGLLAIPGAPKQKSVMGGLLAASSFAPGIGDFTGPMADAHMYATDPSSRTPGNYAMSLAGLLPFVPSLAGITAFHGSPHLFDNFDMAKIGTGEGAQAYGHGLYFAEAPEVAKGYRDTLARPFGVKVDGAFKSKLDDAEALAAGGLGYSKGDYDAAIKDLDEVLRPNVPKETYEKARKLLETRAIQNGGTGALYTVDIPDEAVARMLDWDAPLSEQPEAVRKAFLKAQANGDELLAELLDTSAAGMQMQGMVPNAKGSAAYKTMAELLGGDPAKASNALRAAGITGIKYYDQGSRATGQGTRNFVVFDDKLPKILKRE